MQFKRSAGNVTYIVQPQSFSFDRDAIIVEIENHFVVDPAVNLRVVAFQQQAIVFTGEMIAPYASLRSNDKIGVVTLTFPGERRRTVETNAFFSEGNLSSFKDKQKSEITETSGQNRTD